VVALFLRHDPVGINYEINPDEYDPEARTVLPRLPAADSVDDVRQILHDEFAHWFGNEIAGPESDYGPLARELWEMWLARGSANLG
jgi:hypothetical protein